MPTYALSQRGTMEKMPILWHTHDYHQLLIAEKGLMLFEDESRRHVLSGENAAFIPRGLRHQAETIGAEVTYATLYFCDHCWTQYSDLSLDLLPSQIRVFAISSLLAQLLDKLCEAPQNITQEEPQKTALRLLFLLFNEESQHQLPISLPQTDDEQLAPIIAYIDEHYGEEISLVLLGEEFSLSRRTIERLFKKHLHLTFGEYLRVRRIFAATLLLATTQRSMLAISLDVGYQSLSSFYRAFSGFLGVTPRQYRENGS